MKFRVGSRTFVEKIAFGNEERRIAALCSNLQLDLTYSIKIWDLLSFELLWDIKIPSLKIADFRLSSKGSYLFVGTEDGFLLIWREGQMIENIQFKDYGGILSFDFVEDQQMLIISTRNGEVHIYRLELN